MSSAHRLGFAVKVLGDGGLPSHDTRRWQSGPHLRHSLERLRPILDYLERTTSGCTGWRRPSLPMPATPSFPSSTTRSGSAPRSWRRLGALVRERDIRLSSHPGQYTVLNSEDPGVRAAALAELEVQAALFDAMGLGDEAVAVLHVGGTAGGKGAACDRFLAGFEQLSDAARSRLVIENDDRSFGIGDVVALAERTGLRVIWDVLHHHCNDPDGLTDRDVLAAALETWPDGVRPKIHYSSPRLDIEERKTRNGRRSSSGASYCRSCARMRTSSTRSGSSDSCATSAAAATST